jgi:hypothetical protein
MSTKFVCSKETEAQRLIQIAVYVVNRFWQIKGFYLLPRDIPDFSGREIYFPDFNYPKSFWDEAKRLAKLDWVEMPLKTKTEVQIPDPLPPIPPLESKWRKVEKQFYIFCRDTFPDTKFENYEIWITRYNKLSSFTQNKAWVHFEADAGDIAEAILSGTFRQKHFTDGYAWEESEAFVDNLILSSKLHKLFPGWKPTLMGMRANSKYALESKNYFTKLGYATEIKIPENKLTQTEAEIMARLKVNNGSVVDFETIGDIIWKEDACERYSEWAIAQTIHRLRQKIRSLGVTPEIIQTKRGKGYYLLS